MNLMKRSVAALAGAVCCLAAAACSDESTVPTPKPAAVVSQIRYVPAEGSDEDRTLLQFLYGEERRVRLMNLLAWDAEGGIDNMIYEYAYADGRVELGGRAAPRTFLLDEEGRCTEIRDERGRTVRSLRYNSSGYYYEAPADEGWREYEYHLIGDRCNLFRIAEYAGAEQGDARKRSEVRFEYGTQPNDVNLDLFALLTEALHDPALRPGCPMLMGWVGLRNGNLPSAAVRDGETVAYRYENDAEGRPVRIEVCRRSSGAADARIVGVWHIEYYDCYGV